MPNQGFLLLLIDQLTFATLILSLFFILLKKAWKTPVFLFLALNSLYSVLLFLAGWIFGLFSPQYELVSNLSIHIDTLTGLGVLYHIWPEDRYRRFLVFSVVPVLLAWMITTFFMGPQKTYSWNLIAPATWFLLAATYSMSLLYKRSFYHENAHYLSKFLLIAGFLFYNFVYLIIEGCYIVFAQSGGAEDAWHINFWSYFIFRLMMLAGILSWYYHPRIAASNLQINK